MRRRKRHSDDDDIHQCPVLMIIRTGRTAAALNATRPSLVLDCHRFRPPGTVFSRFGSDAETDGVHLLHPPPWVFARPTATEARGG